MRIILIDGNSLMYRAYYGTAHSNLMENKKGEYTNAIYAFANMLQHVMAKPFDYMLIAFDYGKKTFRHEFFSDYKAGRSAMPDELRSQIPNIKRLIDCLGIKRYEQENYEADDIIGTMASLAKEKGLTVDIYSSDKDLLQLVNDKVTLHLTKKGMTELEDYDSKKIIERYGLNETQMIDLKALMGDNSDNLKGIEGVGEKTAIKLLSTYGTLEAVLQNASNIPGKLGEKIVAGTNDALLCKKMVTIDCHAPLTIDLTSTEYKGFNEEELKAFYSEMNFHSFLKKMGNSTKSNFNYRDISSSELSDVLVNDTSIVLEVDNSNYHRGSIIGFGLANNLGCFYLSLSEAEMNFAFSNFLADPAIKKNVFDYKKTIVSLNKIGLDIAGVEFDALLAAYIANPLIGREELKVIADEYITSDLDYDENVFGKNHSLLDADKYTLHIARKAFVVSQIKEPIIENLKSKNQFELFNDIELPLARVLAGMEITGMKIDFDELENQKNSLQNRIIALEDNIYEAVGKEFNIYSPKQVGEVLFDFLKLPVIKNTKTGYSTDIDVLEKLVNEHPAVSLIIEHRRLSKIYSTYIEGIKSSIFDDGKVHTIFKQALTTTGRLSSIEPNLQNIPIRTPEGKNIRKIFIPINDFFLSGDYSQIELRVLAHLANEEQLVKAFKNDEDIHERTAMLIFNRDVVSKEERQRAKAVNFGIIYGISAWGLSEDIHISPGEAKNFIDRYFATFPAIPSFMNQTLADATERGYVLTIMNRRRYIPELKSNVYMQREAGKRNAMNAPIQGSAADIVKKAMVDIDNEMRRRKLRSKLVLQVHDELVFDCVSAEMDIMKQLIKDVMEHVVELIVPLKIEYDSGKNWFDVK